MMSAKNFNKIIVTLLITRHQDFAVAILEDVNAGKMFMFRTAASLSSDGWGV